jgi:ketosteroid isomerase-like protein
MEALADNDGEALIALYAPDAVIESPVIPHLLGTPRGICRGRAEIKTLIDEVTRRKLEARQFFRTPYLTDGRTLVWEYPRETPSAIRWTSSR